MNWRSIWTLVRKDLKVVRQSRFVMLPMIIVPVLLLVIIPGVLVWGASTLDVSSQLSDLETFFANMPEPLSAELAPYSETQQMVLLMALYFFAPLYLIVPLMVASVIAADSFAGEKERKTLEALIYTPMTDTEIFIAKTLSALIPAVVVAWLGVIAYGVIINIGGWSLIGHLFFPNFMWIVLTVWVAPAAAGLGLGAMVITSSKVRSFQEAYQLGGMVVIPVVLLVLGQGAGVIYFSVGLAFGLGLILWLIDLGLLVLGIKTFRRRELIAQL